MPTEQTTQEDATAPAPEAGDDAEARALRELATRQVERVQSSTCT